MKKRTAGIIKTVIIGVICVGIVAGFYYYLTNRSPRSVETTGETDEITSVLSKNLEKDYPASPRAVIKYYNRILLCLYNETYDDEQYQKLLEYDMVELDFDTQALEAAADRAIERGIGARGLRAVLEEVMTPLMYEVPSDPTITRVTITAESVKEHVSPAVEHDPDRTQRPRLGGAALRAERGGVPAQGNVS